ncbi:13221_t:CDS:2 [Entrophospora sp. SA101]|nr:13221_t:CDS:2 [Entrophospora sp. SA101]
MVVNTIPHQFLKRTTIFNQYPLVPPGKQPPPQLNVQLSPITVSNPIVVPINPGIPFSQIVEVHVPAKLPKFIRMNNLGNFISNIAWQFEKCEKSALHFQLYCELKSS